MNITRLPQHKFLWFYCVTLALVVIRVWYDVLYPQLAYEDSTHMLSFFFNTNNPIFILRHLNGYMSIMPNIIAWISVQFPLDYTSYVMTWPCIMLAAFCYFSFSLPSFRKFIADDGLRMLVSIILCAYPLAQGFMISNLNDAHWDFLLLFWLWAMAGAPRNNALWLFQLLALTLCIFSHPLSLAVAPLLMVMWFVNNNVRDRVLTIYYLLAMLVYSRTGAAPDGIGRYLFAIPTGLEIFFQRNIAELLLGAKLRQGLYDAGYSSLINLLGITLTCLPLVICYARRLPWKIFLALLSLLGTAFAFTLVSSTRMGFDEAMGVIYMQRYYYNPRILILLALAIALLHGRQFPSLNIRTILALLLASGYFASINYYNQDLYKNWLHISQPEQALLKNAAADVRNAREGKPYSPIWTGEFTPQWPIYLDIDCHLHRKAGCFAAEKERMNNIGVLEMPDVNFE